ncbi:hypothetical protein [Lysinibacillus sp. NPDC096212]|uniref:hypothetical protein n=1 Tax=Lysinibacillus sp. NPDC096212 TaxID=3364135 RepID=UPI003813206E
MFKTKKICPAIFLSVGLFCLGDSALASESNYEINSIDELKSEIQGSVIKVDSLQDAEKKEIIENTNPEVINQYIDLLEEDLKDLDSTLIDVQQDGYSSEVIHELPKSGGIVKVETSTDIISVEDNFNNIMSRAFIPNISRKFGSYQYNIVYKVENLLLPDAALGLVTYYSVGSYGLKATSCSNSGTKGSLVTDISASCKVTDDKAEKVGYDINAQGDFKITHGIGGVNAKQLYGTITSRVYWNAKGTSAQSVNESYTADF